jgi:hypothetical protein
MVVPPQITQSLNLRTATIAAASIVIVALLAVVLANTADSGKHKNGTDHASSRIPAETSALKLVVGQVDVQSAGPPAKVRSALRRALLQSTQAYVNDAIIAPLDRGKVVNGYETIFDPFVKGAASVRDRAALTEEHTGKAHGQLKATASPVRLDGLGDQNGQLSLVAATFTMNVKATTPAGAVTIRRHTELTFANEFGKWVVTAYRVTVRRSIGARTTSLAAHSGAGATA